MKDTDFITLDGVGGWPNIGDFVVKEDILNMLREVNTSNLSKYKITDFVPKKDVQFNIMFIVDSNITLEVEFPDHFERITSTRTVSYPVYTEIKLTASHPTFSSSKNSWEWSLETSKGTTYEYNKNSITIRLDTDYIIRPTMK